MSKSNIAKKNFIDLYNQLSYDYKNIVLSTFRCLAFYKNPKSRGKYKPYDVAGLINEHQQRLGYSDHEVCEKVNELLFKKKPLSKHPKVLHEDTLYKIKYRNTQTSNKKTK